MTLSKLLNKALLPLDEKIEWSDSLLGKYPDGVIAFSGGRDSTVLVSLSRELGYNHPVLWIDTGFEFPEVYYYIRKIIKRLKIKNFIRIRNRKRVFPRDICLSSFCYEIKQKLAIDYLKEHGRVEFIGIRWDEGRRFAVVDDNGLHKVSKDSIWHGIRRYCPLFIWNFIDIKKYLETRKLPSLKVYDKGFYRSGCYVCPHAPELPLKAFYPALYKKRLRFKRLYPNLYSK